jgi:general secretion pathway protein D
VAATGGDINFFLRALESQNRLEVLSRPQIMATDNQKANINIGQRVPFITNSQITDTGTTNVVVQYQQVGIILDVTPRINPDGFVKLTVAPEISSVSQANVQISPGVKAIIIDSRTASTTVTVQDGHTIILGGLITTSDQNVEDKVPLLGDLPVLGALFKSTHKEKQRKELLIILTPTVIRNVAEGDATTQSQVKGLNLLRQTLHDTIQKSIFRPLDGGAVESPAKDATTGDEAIPATEKKMPSIKIPTPDRRPSAGRSPIPAPPDYPPGETPAIEEGQE